MSADMKSHYRKLQKQCGTFPIARRLMKLGVPLATALEVLAMRH